MALITRVSRLFRADLHAVLDRIEEPDILLRQAVRDMEEELDRDEQRSKRLVHEQTQIDARLQELNQSLERIAGELDVCFASGKDDLARALIRRRLEAQRFQHHLERKRQQLTTTLESLRRRLSEQRAQLEAMRQKAELLTEESGAAEAEEPWPGPDLSVRDEDVEVAFLQEQQRRKRS